MVLKYIKWWWNSNLWNEYFRFMQKRKKMHVYKPHQNLQQLLLTTPKVLVRDKHRHAYKFNNSPDRHYISFFKMYECKWILYKFCNISFVLPICLVFSTSSTYYSCLLFDVSFLSVFVTKCLCVCITTIV